MKNKKIILLLLLMFICILFACENEKITKVSDINEFDKLINSEGVLLYDIRKKEECEKGHIPYFMCMGLEDDLVENIKLLYSTKKTIVFIGSESDILLVFNELEKNGYKNIYYFEGGYENYAKLKGDDFVPAVGCDC